MKRRADEFVVSSIINEAIIIIIIIKEQIKVT